MGAGGRGLAAVILAGGQSRRMGRDKATLEVGGVALARRVADVAAAVADPVVLVAPDGHRARTLRYATITDPGSGPLAALAAALAALDAEHVLALAADHPGLRVELLRLLAGRRGEAAAVVCRRAGRLEPLVAVYEVAAVATVAEARLAAGDRSLMALLEALDVRVLSEPEWRPADPDGRSFIDLDAPEDLQVWERRGQAGTTGTHSHTNVTDNHGQPMGNRRATDERLEGRRMTALDMEGMLDRVGRLLGPDAPGVDEDEAEAVLELARVVAHASERRAAPVTAYLLGMVVAGAEPEARVTTLEELIAKLETKS